MPSNKRKLETFDPNKSDSDDENFELVKERSPRKPKKKPRPASSNNKRRRTRYGGSDIEEDESDSLLEDSFSEAEEDEDVEMDAVTGRRKRQAAKKEVNYEEPSDESEEFKDSQDDESEAEPDASTISKPSMIIKLKITPQEDKPQAQARSTRAGSTTRTRGGAGPETRPSSSGTRRMTRATTEDPDELIELSNSGRHVIRATGSPESFGPRATRGGKGLKKPVSVIDEESHESGTNEFEPKAEEDPTNDEEINNTVDEDVLDRGPPGGDGAGDEEVDAAGGDTMNVDPSQSGQGDTAVGLADDDEDDDMPIRRTRGSRAGIATAVAEATDAIPEVVDTAAPRRLTRGSANRNKATQEQSSDFEPVEESAEEEISESDHSPKKRNGDSDDSGSRGRRSAKGTSKSNRSSRRRGNPASEDEDEIDPDELMEEALELKQAGRKRRAPRDDDILYDKPIGRTRKKVDYTIKPMDAIYAADEDADEATATPSRSRRTGGGSSQRWERNLYTTYGPFGGAGGPAPVIGGPWGTGAAGGADSDSSDDEGGLRPGVGGNVGMTPTSGMPGGLLPGLAQANSEPATAVGGTPSNFGRVKSQKLLADADPLGVDQNVDFSKVGGLAGHIDQLKEMVQMPLLYPELFLKFHVTPPRGVLFHGPPGTGKTLLARALAASVGSGGQKITFYMRKGADALSKWVGEAERQLRLLFEEARKTQPSIIFFDEIDGLAPVRSSKQEQIHASIVSTLLALMDGMDGRGQVIVIGATNRPDNIDPALRRPGRFDREFYFPLPDVEGRKSIINIHTKDWGIDDQFKESLANATKGYGGADLRALCTEAALNAIQRTFPQIYSSNDKLVIDADKIKITAKDFMLSIKKMVPSSERATSSGAAPLPKVVEPLLRTQLKELEDIVDGLIPVKKKTTALQEALYEQPDDADHGFGRETLQQDFEKSRIFRPRLLINGLPGMGQAYIGAALLNHFDGLHVQNFDLPTIYSDSARSAETAIVQLFQEVKRHKPSVIFLPGIDTWYHTLSEAVITTFLGLLRSIPPTDPVLVLGISDTKISDTTPDHVSQSMLRDMFGFSRKNQFEIQRPSKSGRDEFFKVIRGYVRMAPKDFPEPTNRKLRKLETLEVVPPPPPRPPTKEEIKAEKKRDHQLLNLLKIAIGPIMEQIHLKYRKYRNPIIPPSQIDYLYLEQDPNFVRPDVVQFRPFELDKDKDGTPGLRETASGKFYYNLDTTMIEERLSNGFYARPKDFTADIRSLAKDARQSGDKERMHKLNQLLTNVEVDMAPIEAAPQFADCENLYQRQLKRTKEREEKERRRQEEERGSLARPTFPTASQASEPDQAGPIILGEPFHIRRNPALGTPQSSLSNGHSSLSNHNSGSQAGHLSNGSSAGSAKVDDIRMGGTDGSPDSQGLSMPLAKWRGLSHGISNVSSYPTGQSSLSQTSGFQQLPPGVRPESLINYASTTSSGDKSKRTSDGNSTQVTNAPNMSPTNESPGLHDSQLPDTQGGTSSEREWLHSQAHGIARGQLSTEFSSQTPSSNSQPSQHPPVPLFNAPQPLPYDPVTAAAASAEHEAEADSVVPTSQTLIIDEPFIQRMFDDFVLKTSGCSIEQLEQINRELMDDIWKARGDWNRNRVAMELAKTFNETITDIEEMQKILKPSQEF